MVNEAYRKNVSLLSLMNGKAAGKDGVNGEMVKGGGDMVVD